jgi:uncharacterized membrane protein (UPF0136 family)
VKNEPFLKKEATSTNILISETEHAKRSSYLVEIAKLQAAAFGWCCASLAAGAIAVVASDSFIPAAVLVTTGLVFSWRYYRRSMSELVAPPQ